MKLAVVTGGTGGIGSAIVESLVDNDYHVIACGRDEEKLKEMRYEHGHVTPCAFDLLTCSREEISTFLDAALLPWKYRVDLLVCAHGFSPITTPTLKLNELLDVTPMLTVDVLGVMNVAQVIGSFMVGQMSGSMVFVSSLHARMTYPARAPYAMAKASICSLARALAVEWGQYGVRVNSISPWQTMGKRTSSIADDEKCKTGEDTIECYLKKSPLRSLVSPDDIAETVLFLSRNGSITGQDIILDCGVSASMFYKGF